MAVDFSNYKRCYPSIKHNYNFLKSIIFVSNLLINSKVGEQNSMKINLT